MTGHIFTAVPEYLNRVVLTSKEVLAILHVARDTVILKATAWFWVVTTLQGLLCSC